MTNVRRWDGFLFIIRLGLGIETLFSLRWETKRELNKDFSLNQMFLQGAGKLNVEEGQSFREIPV